MSRTASQNGEFNGAPPWRPGLALPRFADAAAGRLDPAEVEEARRQLGGASTAPSLTAALTEMGWDPELMCWTDAEAVRQASEAAVREIESYPAATADELARLRNLELQAAGVGKG